jgi:hypothetical protein
LTAGAAVAGTVCACDRVGVAGAVPGCAAEAAVDDDVAATGAAGGSEFARRLRRIDDSDGPLLRERKTLVIA